MKLMKLRKSLLIAILTIAMMALFFAVQIVEAYTVNEVHLKNGDVYDITSCPKNTIIYIDDKTASNKNRGEVTLKGSSEKVWVDISVSTGKTVNVKLADGLSITPRGPSAYGTGKNNDTLGWSCAGIYIDETKHAGGIVILTSKKGANIRVESYQRSIWQAVPAIMKNDSKTKLVFDTEDKSDPGTIVAEVVKGGDFSGTCAIGAYGHGALGSATSSYTVGNIEFHAGNIEAYGYNDGPGIGAYAYSHVKDLDFTGAHVKAYAGNWRPSTTSAEAAGAGIGTGFRGNVDTITISGGYVEAYGRGAMKDPLGWSLRTLCTYCGPGIGVGNLGHLNEIKITGGTVVAYGGTCDTDSSESSSGCGIGTAVDCYDNTAGLTTADKITITGGDITAYGGDAACGIGGCVDEILIAPDTPDTELTITAKLDGRKDREGGHHALGAGIGIANNASNKTFSKYSGKITIKGGDITATGAHAGSPGWYGDGYLGHGGGIGPTYSGKCSSINISGGKIHADGGYCSPGIGGYSVVSGELATVDNIHISGGTITATKPAFSRDGDPLSGIGGRKNSDGDRTDIVITGGNVISEGTDYAIGYDEAGQPKNDADETVYGTKFKFNPEADEWTKVDSFNFVPALSYDYGLNDVYVKSDIDSDDNILEFWIPKSKNSVKYNCSTNIGDRRYGAFDSSFARARVEAGDTATLSAYTDITYVNEATGNQLLGYGVYGSDKLSISSPSPATPGYELEGYKDESGKKVANAETFEQVQLPLLQSTAYVDNNGKWNAKDKTLTLYMMLHQTEYSVGYDKNKPDTASHDVEGEQMSDSTFSTSETGTLSENKYSLKGWTFTGWNTKKDGSGTSFNDKGDITFNEDWGAKLTLYAQWEPKTYTITFESGDGQNHRQQAEYDTPGTLDAFSNFNWTIPEGKMFHGWSTSAFGSFYEDGEDFCNFCTLDDTGDPVGNTLMADWVGNGCIKVTVTVDGAPTDVTNNMYIQKVDGGDTERLELTDSGNGRYEASLAGLPAGEYQLMMDSDTYQIPQDYQDLGQLTESSTVSVVIDYYTVTMQKDDQVANAYVKEVGSGDPVDSMKVADGTEVVIGASADPGYHFDGYSYYGVEPGWGEDPSVNEQTITVNGKVDITAHAEANVYKVKYDQNKPQNATHDVEGEMDDQDFVYDEPQNLKACGYTLTGWTFAGWNTEADGSGTPYDDKGAAQNLTEEDGGTVPLYAQWTPNKYNVIFSATNATGGTMDPQEFAYDTAQNLTPNAFERTDWHFTSWNTEPTGGGTTYADGAEVKNLTLGKSFTLYAQWEHDYYTVNFDKNDEAATGEMEEERVWTNSAYELPLCGFIKPGYHLEAWTTEPDGSGASYEDGEAVENLTAKDGSITLYAQWEPNNYTVKFDANGGKGKMDDQDFVYDEAQDLEANAFSKKHYRFTGWNIMPEGQGESYKDKENVINLTTIPNGEVTLYAQWEPIEHSITFDLNGGTLEGKTGMIVVEANEGDVITVLDAPTREGYTFKYWKGSKYYPGDKYTVEDDHTLSAVWEENKTPGTGDDSQIWFWLAGIVLALAGLAVMLRKVRKRV